MLSMAMRQALGICKRDSLEPVGAPRSRRHRLDTRIRHDPIISYGCTASCRQPMHGRYCGDKVARRRPLTGASALSQGSEDWSEPRGKRVRKPEWVRILEEDVDNDPAVAKLLEGTDGDPDRIREKMQYALKEQDIQREGQGAATPPHISFRAISPLGLWVWLEFLEPPLSGERELLEGILKSWFAVGKLGGYNSQNIQVYENADDDQSFFEYDNEQLEAGETRMASYIHDMGELEYQDNWARVWVDMGTADELALDVLLNMLVGFSTEMCGLKSIRLGGQNEDWPVPEEHLAEGLMSADGDYMKVGMDPMKVPEGLDEEFTFMDDEGMFESTASGAGSRRRGAGARGPAIESADDDIAGVGGGLSGYAVDAGPFGAGQEEVELKQLAAKLKRRPQVPKVPAPPGPPRVGGRGAGYYGSRDIVRDSLDAVSVDPNDYEFITDDDGALGDGMGAADEVEPAGAGAGAGDAKRPVPWGASFIRRRVSSSGSGSGGSSSS